MGTCNAVAVRIKFWTSTWNFTIHLVKGWLHDATWPLGLANKAKVCHGGLDFFFSTLSTNSILSIFLGLLAFETPLHGGWDFVHQKNQGWAIIIVLQRWAARSWSSCEQWRLWFVKEGLPPCILIGWSSRTAPTFPGAPNNFIPLLFVDQGLTSWELAT